MSEELEPQQDNPVDESQIPSDPMEARALARAKWIHFVRQRLLAGPGGSALFHVLFLIIIINVAVGVSTDKAPTVQVQMIQPETVQQPEEKQEPIQEEVVEPTEVITENPEPVADNVMVIGDPTITDPGKGSGGSDADSAGIGSGLGADAGFEISVVKSPLIIKGLYASRTAGGRQAGMSRYGGGGHTEGAVLRALRWLKKNQESNGSWTTKSGGGNGNSHNGAPAGMTGMALLAFLAHGETPASPEFGATVEKAIKYLAENQGADGKWKPVPYEHPIATYAMCEAFSMTKLPSIKEKAKKGIEAIVNGQNPAGGFDYELTPDNRNDTSVMGWCAQALKAGKIAGVECAGLEAAIKKAVDGFKGNYQGDSTSGGFGYTGPAKSGLTGVGVLCNQLLGQAKSPEAKGGLATLMATDQFAWEGVNKSKIYYWYYNTQARFHEGGECWKSWNKQFSVPLVKAQTIIPKDIATPGGKMVDTGYWDSNNDWGGRVMDTTLCALMLQVYYRYLPTFAKPEELAAPGAAAPADGGKGDNKDLGIQIKL